MRINWSQQDVDLLGKLVDQGLTAGDIAKNFSGKSRNAVIGKIRRLGLQLQGPSRGGGRPRTKAQVRSDNGILTKARSQKKFANLPAPAKPEPANKHHKPLNGKGVRFLDRVVRKQCCWPLWPDYVTNPPINEKMVCGQQIPDTGNNEFCAHHREQMSPRKP